MLQPLLQISWQGLPVEPLQCLPPLLQLDWIKTQTLQFPKLELCLLRQQQLPSLMLTFLLLLLLALLRHPPLLLKLHELLSKAFPPPWLQALPPIQQQLLFLLHFGSAFLPQTAQRNQPLWQQLWQFHTCLRCLHRQLRHGLQHPRQQQSPLVVCSLLLLSEPLPHLPPSLLLQQLQKQTCLQHGLLLQLMHRQLLQSELVICCLLLLLALPPHQPFSQQPQQRLAWACLRPLLQPQQLHQQQLESLCCPISLQFELP
mmetsp:Transcript_55668/g.99124  ORF Transcript_55668/g.99124 Transcript_55668/m.99124 type:complete len:258 (+) Transcript_55668:2258-3031(+)